MALINFGGVKERVVTREEFSLAEFEEVFALERISLGGPVFDVEKLTWLNGRYLRQLDAVSALPKEYPAWMIERQSADRLAK